MRGAVRWSDTMTRPRRSASLLAAEASPATGGWPLGVIFVGLLLATLVAYGPCLRGDFLWDDAGHVTSPSLRSWTGLWRIWSEPGVTQQYYPLLHSAFWLEHRLWGDATVGYHLINVVWHAISASLFVAILRRLHVPGAWLAGLLFALHPVCVESVAWISEQKNTLSTVFYLAAALAWLRFAETNSQLVGCQLAGANEVRAGSPRTPWRVYALATLFYLCALLTKSVTATLPAALLVVAWWQRGRLHWRRDLGPLLPWLAAGVGAGLFTAWFERVGIGAQGTDFNLSLVERGLLAGRVFWFYLAKLVWPVDLAFFYPRWHVDASVGWQYLFPSAALALLGVLIWRVQQGRGRGVLAAFLLFGGTLFPVLGFVNVYPFVFSYVADHFQYLASLGPIALVAAAGTVGLARLRGPRWLGPTVATGLLLVLAGLTWQQSRMYRDVFALYETTLERNPSSWTAHLNLGTALSEAGKPNEALPHLRRALELKPDFTEILNSLGNVLNRLGRPAEARPLLERAIQLQPRFATAHNTLGVVLMSLGRTEDGLASFQRAVAIDPMLTVARVNLGWALANSGHSSEAIAELEHALQLQPNLADAEFKLGLTLALNSRLPEGISHLSRAVELEPESAEKHFVLGGALLETGQRAEAMEQFEETLRLDPHHAGAREGVQIVRQSGH